MTCSDRSDTEVGCILFARMTVSSSRPWNVWIVPTRSRYHSSSFTPNVRSRPVSLSRRGCMFCSTILNGVMINTSGFVMPDAASSFSIRTTASPSSGHQFVSASPLMKYPQCRADRSKSFRSDSMNHLLGVRDEVRNVKHWVLATPMNEQRQPDFSITYVHDEGRFEERCLISKGLRRCRGGRPFVLINVEKLADFGVQLFRE